jgi:hypothetical protein
MNFKALCFVDMPFGQKPDLKSGGVVQICNDEVKKLRDEVVKLLGLKTN